MNVTTIDFINDDIGWIAGDNGTLLKTVDGGENWNTIQLDEDWDISMIDFINDSIGWAIGSISVDGPDPALILKTTNGASPANVL